MEPCETKQSARLTIEQSPDDNDQQPERGELHMGLRSFDDDVGEADFDECLLEAAIDDDGDRLEDSEQSACFLGLAPHRWKMDTCMICTSCGECTQYGKHCANHGLPGRMQGWLVCLSFFAAFPMNILNQQ